MAVIVAKHRYMMNFCNSHLICNVMCLIFICGISFLAQYIARSLNFRMSLNLELS